MSLVRVLLLMLLGACVLPLPVAADPETDETPQPRAPTMVEVPDVRRLAPAEAAKRLVAAGLNPGRLFDITVDPDWKLGLVVQQSPPPRTRRKWGAEVALAISSRRMGPREGRPPPLAWPRVKDPPLEPRPALPLVPFAPTVPGDQIPPPPTALPPATEPDDAPPEPKPPAPSPPMPDPGPSEAVGSPDAPAPAPATDPDQVPALLGLGIADAEHLAGAAGLQLHPVRVAGHPVGRVLAQVPAPGAPRPVGGVVKVTVASGGDHQAEIAPPPMVEVLEITVPDLLDRTEPQARRILTDLGLVADVTAALHGPAGRVADQQPAAGTVVPKGSKVEVRVAPPAAPRPPARPEAEPETAPPAAVAGAPTPLSPAAGTEMGPDRQVAIGLMWRPLRGADAYVAEVEERGPDGWMPIARRVSRKSAVVLDIERLAPTPGPLRWRVRGVTKGRQGAPSTWVELR